MTNEDPQNQNGTSSAQSPLELEARALLASSLRTLSTHHKDDTSTHTHTSHTSHNTLSSHTHSQSPTQIKYVYPSPCSPLNEIDETNGINNFNGIAESSTTLITARSFSKLGRSDLSWSFLKMLFDAQGSSGFMPRFVYFRKESEGVEGADGAEGHGIFQNDEFDKFRSELEFESKDSEGDGGDGSDNIDENDEWATYDGWGEEFIGPYPGPKQFPAVPKENAPPQSQKSKKLQSSGSSKSSESNEIKLWSSGTIMAPPHHATAILDVFYLSNQTSQDVDYLAMFYKKIELWHSFLHGRLRSNCTRVTEFVTTAGGAGNGGNHHGDFEGKEEKEEVSHYFPCIPINHPWETEIELTSPLWNHALKNVSEIVSSKNWKPSFEIPSSVKHSFDYPGDDVYNSLLYLNDCLSHPTQEGVGGANGALGVRGERIGANNANHAHSANSNYTCPFAMIDVGFMAAFSKSEHDLIRIGQILIDKDHSSQPSWNEVELATKRSQRSRGMLGRLWSEGMGNSLSEEEELEQGQGSGFFNRVLNLELNENGTFTSNFSTPVELPVAYNFLALWDHLANTTVVDQISSQLLFGSGPFSFSCGDYPLWSYGGCDQTSTASTSALVSPLLNYRIANGLRRNQEGGISHYIKQSTFNLLCNLLNSERSDLMQCKKPIQFPIAFDSRTHLPLGTDECSLTSTLTAAITLDMLIPDKPFHYQSEPPISSSSVIFLILVELIIALAVGVACLLLSLNLMRRAKADEEGDGFVQIVREEELTDLCGEEDRVNHALGHPTTPLAEEDVAGPSAAFEVSNHERLYDVFEFSSGLLSRLNPFSYWDRGRPNDIN